jgi:CheY-like chemotaxis protein
MGKKILLVEDDPIARRSMERLICGEPRLAPIEPVIVQAASGQQGLAVFVSERPDLIITDLFMPAMDGLAFCRALREAPFGQDVPIVVISGIYKDPELARNLLEEVQALFLPKPIETDALVATILGCLGLGQGDATAAATELPNQTRPTEPRDLAIDLTGLEPPPPPDDPVRVAVPSAVALATSSPHTTRVPMAPSSEAPVDSGLLADRHVARIIFDLAETDATGTLSLAHGRVRKDLYVRTGRVVAADSNLRQEALGTLLCAKGIIDEGQLNFLLGETKRRGHKMGAVLVELGWLTPEEVLQALAAQARKRITDALRWNEGTYTFAPGDTFGEHIIEHDLDVARTVLLGLYRSATPETLVERFDQSGACPIRFTPRFEAYRELFTEAFGGDITQVIADAPTVGALSLREDAHVVMAEIDALIETGLAVLGEPADVEPLPPMTLESSFSLEKLGSELVKRFESIVEKPSMMSFSEIRKGDILPLPQAQAAFARVVDEANSGALDIGYHGRQEHTPVGATLRAATDDLRQRLLHEFLMIHGKSHYDVLGVPEHAPAAQIEEAVRAKLAQFPAPSQAEATLGPADRARLEVVRAAVEQAGRVLVATSERRDYDDALAAKRSAPGDPLGAELAFGEALQLFQADRVDEALAKFETAVTARPDQALYHAYLGWADFVAHGPDKATDARERLQHALALDPDLAEAHTMLGRLAATEDDAATARQHLEKSLTIDADQPDTVALLLEAYSRLPTLDPRGAERFLRKLVSALGEQDEPLRKRLWSALADLYENQLADRNSARIAYDTAARLGPNNLEVVRKSIELNAEDPTRWRETAHALAAEWQLHPNELSPARKLMHLFDEHGAHDGSAATAAAMVLRGIADDATRALAEARRPKSLELVRSPLPEDLLVRAGYREDEKDLETLAALLVEFGVLKPFARDELGLLDSDTPLAPAQQPEAFRSILTYVCGLFHEEVPKAILCLPVLGGDARMADLRPPALLCGEALLNQQDTIELGFRLSRAVALAAPGRLAGSARSGRQLRPYFLAALALAQATAQAQGAATEDASNAIAALTPARRARVLDAAQTIKQKYDNLNLSVWGRGLARTATRLALLVSGDLLRVGRAVAEEDGPAALDDLLTFALSLDYLDLRHDMGFGRT